MNTRTGFLALGLLALSGTAALHAANWPQWRGPFFNGSTTEKDLPATFSKTENVLWVAPMPGASAATPIIWGDHVFVSSADKQTRTLRAIALDRRTGKELWNQEAGVGLSQDEKSNYASPSPATDGERVVFFYGNGDLAVFDFAGQKLWSRNVGPFAFLWTFSSSPLLYEGKLYLQILQRNVPVNERGPKERPIQSYLLALDPKTGKELWRHTRPSEARAESLEAFSTPVPFQHGARAEILITGGDCISSHDPATGAELWRWGTWNPTRITHWRLVPSPVGGAGVALACAPKGSPVYAVKAGQKGELDDSAIAWKSQDREVSSDVSTPLFYKDRFYVLNSDRRTLSCVEPASGKVLWSGSLESRAKLEASPTGADDKIYLMNHRADVFVASAGDEFKVLHTTAMGDEGDHNVRSTIAVAAGCLYVRTPSKLYCIGLKR
jgi:outer membrane protein assembly factor BamB